MALISLICVDVPLSTYTLTDHGCSGMLPLSAVFRRQSQSRETTIGEVTQPCMVVVLHDTGCKVYNCHDIVHLCLAKNNIFVQSDCDFSKAVSVVVFLLLSVPS